MPEEFSMSLSSIFLVYQEPHKYSTKRWTTYIATVVAMTFVVWLLVDYLDGDEPMTKPMQFGTYKEMTIRIPVELCDDFEELSTRMKVSNSQFVTSAVTYFILRMNESQRMDHADNEMRLWVRT